MKVRDVIKAMENDGWVKDRTRGDHRQYRHPDRPDAGTATVPGHPGDDLPAGTLTLY
ncbi:MAG: type II toxin-antitoxin system HicA family toxin [Acidobacteria bacterium]|nr:type II toxin-antitoxin system HicA family toxin [Acidobacteriota bacterium]